jgi:hypothetical protein
MPLLIGLPKEVIIMRSDIVAWSLLAPTPQCYYHSASDSNIVYWRGIAMAKTQAMIIVQEKWLQSYASPEMKKGAYNQFKQAYYLGAFGPVDWTYSLTNTILDANSHLFKLRKWIKKQDPAGFIELTKNYDIKTAMSWFTKDYEQILND